MVQIIKGVLTPLELEEIRTEIATGSFVDGSNSAQGFARDVKHNEQLIPAGHVELLERLNKRLGDIPRIVNSTLAAKLGGTRISRYRKGMGYGSHVDAAYIQDIRTDFSVTLFLTAPESYDGGELVIESELGETQIKLPAGDMVLYPSDRLHHVNVVTRGERLAMVAWIQSQIQEPDQRQTLIELRRALQQVQAMEQTEEIKQMSLRLVKAIHKLERMWVR